MPAGETWLRAGGIPDNRAEIDRSGLFEDVAVRHFDWEISYNAEEYICLLDTVTGHVAMEAWQRGRLYAEIRWRLAMRPEGRVRRHCGAVLHVTRRADPTSVS